MNDLLPDAHDQVSIADQITEVKRELSQRDHVYPRMVANGKLTQQKATRQTKLLEAVLRTLEGLR